VQASASGDRTLGPRSWTLIGTVVTLCAVAAARLVNRRHHRLAAGSASDGPADGPADGTTDSAPPPPTDPGPGGSTAMGGRR
jgi:hypothetical protein